MQTLQHDHSGGFNCFLVEVQLQVSFGLSACANVLLTVYCPFLHSCPLVLHLHPVSPSICIPVHPCAQPRRTTQHSTTTCAANASHNGRVPGLLLDHVVSRAGWPNMVSKRKEKRESLCHPLFRNLAQNFPALWKCPAFLANPT